MRKLVLLTAALLVSSMAGTSNASNLSIDTLIAAGGINAVQAGKIVQNEGHSYGEDGVVWNPDRAVGGCLYAVEPRCWLDVSLGQDFGSVLSQFSSTGFLADGLTSVPTTSEAIQRAINLGTAISHRDFVSFLTASTILTDSQIQQLSAQFASTPFATASEFAAALSFAAESLQSANVETPEPMSFLLVAAGLAGVRAARRRRRSN